MKDQPLRILRMSDVEDRTGLGRTTIIELERQGMFPKRVPLTKGTSGYLESEVSDWIAGRKRLRDADNAQLLANDRILNADLKRPEKRESAA